MALVPAAGEGARLGSAVPKALVDVGGASLLEHAVRRLLDSGRVDAVVVAAPPARLEQFVALLTPFGAAVRVVAGGSDRTSSVRAALDAVPAGTYDVVLVHDAARAFTPPAVTRAVVDAVCAGRSAVVPALPVVDTVKLIDSSGAITATPDRSALRAIQTPQGFAEGVLRAAHAAGFDAATDDAGLVERLGERVHTVEGHPHAMKVTTPFDLAVVRAVLALSQEAQ